MERFFGGLISVLGIPILVLNLLGGIAGGIWLMIAGEWSLFIGGLLYIFFGAMILGILLMPSLLFAGPAGIFAEKRKYALVTFFGSLGLLYTYGLIAISTYYIADIALGFASAPLWASLLWMYAVVMAPWQYMASKEQENTSTLITTFALALGVIVLIVCIGFFGMSLSQAYPFFISILLLSAAIQLLFTIALAREEKLMSHSEVIDTHNSKESFKNHERTWRDIE